MVFDPGATTGFAALDTRGRVLITMPLPIDELEEFLYFVSYIEDVTVVVEDSPNFGHHSPVTRRAEELILDTFPDAHRIPPTRWKSHPAFHKRIQTLGKLTTHEHDAVRLGKWFQAEYRKKNARDTGHTSTD